MSSMSMLGKNLTKRDRRLILKYAKKFYDIYSRNVNLFFKHSIIKKKGLDYYRFILLFIVWHKYKFIEYIKS